MLPQATARVSGDERTVMGSLSLILYRCVMLC